MRSILITGGTGSFGRAFVRHLLAQSDYGRIIVYSRDEQKQEEMARELEPLDRERYPRLRFFLGDVRDQQRLAMAMSGVSTVVHAAALKIIHKCEYDPIEAVRTNIDGAANIIQAAMDEGVGRVIALSTDKAVSPINLYGATKLAAEKLFIAANNLSGASSGERGAKFGIVRYGNVAFSRGSVIPYFKKLKLEAVMGFKMKEFALPLTHPEATRFWITLDDAVKFVSNVLPKMQGGEVFIPRMGSFKIANLARAIHDGEPKIVGLRPGEKLHEDMITEHDRVHSYDDYFIILPPWQQGECCEPFKYSSMQNPYWMPDDKLKELVA